MVFHAAGSSGLGVIQAARETTESTGKQVWAIGSDSDQFFDVSGEDAEYVLTSIVRKFDAAVIDAADRLVNDEFVPGMRVLTLRELAVDYSRSGEKLASSTVETLEGTKESIIGGEVSPPLAPSDDVLAPLGREVLGSVEVAIDEGGCHSSYEGPDQLPTGATLRLDAVNNTAAIRGVAGSSHGFEAVWAIVEAAPATTASGYLVLDEGDYSIDCLTASTARFRLASITDSGAGGFTIELEAEGPEPSPPDPGTGAEVPTVHGRGVLTVGMCACDISPFSDGDGGGFEPDLIRESAGRIGLATDFTGFESFDVMDLLALVGTDADVFLSLAITDARAEVVDFSTPYFRDYYALVVNPGLRPDIGGFADLGEGDVIDAGVPGLAQYEWANANLVDAGVSFGFTETDGLLDGSLAGWITNSPVASLVVADQPELEIVDVVDAGSASGFAVDPENPELLEALNSALRAMIEDGTYHEIHDRWFDRPEGSVAR